MQVQRSPQSIAAEYAAETFLTAAYGQTETEAFEAAAWATALQGTTVRPTVAEPEVHAYRDAAGNLVGHVAVTESAAPVRPARHQHSHSPASSPWLAARLREDAA